MNRLLPTLFLIIFFFFLSSMSEAQAGLDPDSFRYITELKGPFEKSKMYKIHLSDEILSKLNEDLSDIRLFDENNKEIPFTIIANIKPKGHSENYTLPIIGYGNEKNVEQITVKMPDRYKTVSTINFVISGQDFKRKVVAYGSDDLNIWKKIAEDRIYDFSSRVNLRKTKIIIPKSNNRYYRFKFYMTRTSMEESRKITQLKTEDFELMIRKGETINPLTINAVNAVAEPENAGEIIFDQKIYTKYSSLQAKDGKTIIVLDESLPIDKVSFDITNVYYYRAVKFYAIDSFDDKNMVPIGDGNIFKFPFADTNESINTIDIHMPIKRYCKIVIDNKNNQPLDIKTINISWIRMELIFITPDNSQNLRLYFNNADLIGYGKPNYDIVNFVNQTNWYRQNYEQISIQSIKENQEFIKKKLQKPAVTKSPSFEITLLNVIVVAIVSLLGTWLYILLNKKSKKVE